MKRTVPLLIAAICGVVLIITAFIPATVTWGETAAVWFDVLAAIAFVLGGGNLLKVHLQKVSDRAAGWAYSFITVTTFLITLIFGMVKWGVLPSSDQEFYGQTFVNIPVHSLPDELKFSLPVDLPGDMVDHEFPASIRQQFRAIVEDRGGEKRITALEFTGWPTPGQANAMLGFHDLLEWKSAVEGLLKLSSTPPELAGKVSYLADHQALSMTGALLSADADRLKAISADPVWRSAVEEIQQISNQQTTVKLELLPAQLEDAPVLKQFSEMLKLNGHDLTVTGPLTPAMRAALTEIFPRVRPMTEAEIEAFVKALSDLPGGLKEDQKNLLKGLLQSLWNENQLISVLNDAGKSRPGTKTFAQLLQEKQSGVTELVTSTPPAGGDVVLNEAQVEALKAYIYNPSKNLSGLGTALAASGDWIPAQQAALLRFLGSQPTEGTWKRTLAAALTPDKETLSKEQFQLLLDDYRIEHLWNAEVFRLFSASHRVKYPWSGAYLQDGTPFWWTYEYTFKPLTSTMFALLAFYVASAAFRAFRAKNLEAFLLLATAFIILLGRTYAGAYLSNLLPEYLSFLKVENVTMFIMTVINVAGNRAIMIGIALGIVSTSLKILLGVDRSYLGSGD